MVNNKRRAPMVAGRSINSVRRNSPPINAILSFVTAITALAALVFTGLSLEAAKQQSKQEATVASNSSQSTTTVVNLPSWALVVMLGLAGVVALAVILYLLQKYQSGRLEAQLSKDIQERELQAMNSALDRLRERMTLPSLVELNRLMLDKYHDIATDQANSSYVSSKRAMWAGFAWLLACSIGGATVAVTTGDKIILASLAAIGGSLAAFLSRTYIRVYERSLEQLNQYFSQPLLNSYYLTAERLISEMSVEEQDQARNRLLDQLLHGSGAIISGNGATPVEGGRLRNVGRVGRPKEKVRTTNGEPAVRERDQTSS